MSEPRTRTVVLLRKDVAPSKWHESFDALVAEAEGGADGVLIAQQPTDKSGTFLTSWTELDAERRQVMKEVAPRGWAAFYRGEGRKDGVAFLHVQNY